MSDFAGPLCITALAGGVIAFVVWAGLSISDSEQRERTARIECQQSTCVTGRAMRFDRTCWCVTHEQPKAKP